MYLSDLRAKRAQVSSPTFSTNLDRKYSYDNMCWLRGSDKRDRASASLSSSSSAGDLRRRAARRGDVVTISFTLTPEDGFVPHTLFDTSGERVSLVLGWGNYLPGLHDLIEGMRPGDRVEGASVDAGWGRRDPAFVAEVSKAKLEKAGHNDIQVGDELRLAGGTVRVTVVAEKKDRGTFVVDANPPLAGSSYSCDLEVLDVQSPPETLLCSREDGEDDGSGAPALCGEAGEDDEITVPKKSEDSFLVAAFAVGCFWGGELAFMREPGVAGTRVGYTQGSFRHPTYREVCEGSTGHREAILVVYDPSVVSYERLAEIAMERMDVNATSSGGAGGGEMMHNMFEEPDEPESEQYRHGMYYYSEEQKRSAERVLEERGGGKVVEVLPATTFYLAEEKHQNHLLKGGQSAQTGCKEPIRCFG